MTVVAYLESNGESVYEKPCRGDADVADGIRDGMNEAVAAAHECSEPVIVEATWENDSTAKFRITVEAL